MDSKKIDKVVSLLQTARNLLFITGAGISADSGLPTYRGIGGLYNNKHTDEGIAIEDALSGQMLHSHPEIAWKYIYQIEEACRDATFNRGHQVIAEMENHFPRVWTLTQNIDGFHRAAGAKNVIDIHGDIHFLSCMSCSYGVKVENYAGLKIPPICPQCGGILRPNVVLFGEMLPQEKCHILNEELEKGFDLIFTIGTTSIFPYIAYPVIDAHRAGIATVEINPGMTQVSRYVDIKFSAGSAATLDAIWRRYLESGTPEISKN